MSNYKFKLQKLLDIRLDREEESKRAFREAQREKDLVKQRLDALNDNYKKYSGINSKGTLIEQKIKQNYLQALSVNINNTNKELTNKDEFLELRRQDLKQKQIDRKTVEVLKEKKKMEFMREQDFIEQKTNDEFALYGFIRTRERGWKSASW